MTALTESSATGAGKSLEEKMFAVMTPPENGEAGQTGDVHILERTA